MNKKKEGLVKFYTLLVWVILFSFKAYSVDYYWVNGTGNWSDFAGHWSLSSGGGTMHSTAPSINDNVFFDTNSFTAGGQIVTLDINGQCNDFDWTTATNNPTFAGISTDSLNVYGSFYLNAVMNYTHAGELFYLSQNTDTVNTFGISIPGEVTFNGAGTFTLESNFTNNQDLQLIRGILEARNFSITTQRLNTDYVINRTLSFTSGNLILTGDSLVWNASSSNLTFTTGTGSILVNYTGANKVYFNPAGVTHNNITFSSPLIEFLEGGNYNTLTFPVGGTVIFPQYKVQSFSGLVANGNCGTPIQFLSDGTIPTGQAILNSVGGAINVNYIRVKDIQAMGATFTANNSLDEGNNTGWTISGIADASNMYWIGGTGSWNDPAHWSYASGGGSSGCVPGPNNDVFFDALSGFVSDTVFVDNNGYCKSMDWTGVTNNPVLSGNQNNKIQLTGSINLASNLIADFTGDYEFNSTITDTVNLQGAVLNGDMVFLGGGTWNIKSDIVCTKKVYFNEGTFQTNEFNLTIDGFVASTTLAKIIDITKSTLTLNGIDTVWAYNATASTFTSDTSIIILNSTDNLPASFYGGGEQYNSVIINTTNGEIYEANTFNTLEIKKGKTVSLASGILQQVDSLIAIGSCDSIITIQSTANISIPAQFEKTGYDSVSVSYCLIKNIDAVVTTTEKYTAQNSVLQNSTQNWDTLGSAGATTYYWVGNTGVWSNVANWSLISGGGGGGVSCLPTAVDTVIFDNNSFSANNQVVTLDIDGQCAKMDWSAITFSPEFAFEKDLNVSYEAVFHNNMIVTRNNQFSSIFMLTDGDAFLSPQGAVMDINIIYTADSLNDTLYIISKLNIGENGLFIQSRGTLINQADTIIASSFNLFTDEDKHCDLGTGYLGLKYGWNSDGLTNTTLNSGTSHIEILGSLSSDYLLGNDFTFYDVTINYEGDSTQIYGGNTYNKLIINPGVNLKIENGKTQTISDSLFLQGNCNDSISIVSTVSGTQASINPNGTSYKAECLNVKDIASLSIINTLFSTNLGGNNGQWTFLITPPTVPNFTIGGYEVCLGDSTYFTNTSTAYSGNPADLTFIWDFGNGDSSTLVNPVYAHLSGGKYDITLVSEYKNGCKDSYLDSVNINDPIVNLFMSDADTTICDGEEMTFVTGLTGDTYQFFINSSPVTTMGTSNTYITDSLNNNDTIIATVLLNGCPAISPEKFIFTVNPNPTTVLTVSSPTDTICAGDSIVFKGSGATHYQFFKNEFPLSIPTTIDSVKLGDLITNDSIYLIGSYAATGCQVISDTHVFVVNPIPSISIVNDSGTNVICQGDNLSFTARGGDTYQYYVNSSPQGAFSPVNTFATTSLNHTDTVYVIGDSLGCQSKGNFDFVVTVNAIPVSTIASSATNSTICDGDNLIYTFGGASIYEIFINDASQGPATGSNIFNSASFNDGDRVLVKGETFGCEDLSDEDTITVVPLPIVTVINSDADTSICVNDTVTFTASGATQYEFYINGVPVTSTSAANTYETDSLKNGEIVSVKGYANNCEDFSSNVFTFEVKPVPNINFITSDTIICEGESSLFIAVGGTSYEYFVNGTSQGTPAASSNFNTDSLPVGNPLVEVKGYINGCGSWGNDNYNVQVKPLPTLIFNIVDDTICSGDSIHVNASGASTYQFYIDGVAQAAYSNDSTFSTSSISSGQVLTVKGKNNGCEKLSDSAYTVQVNAKPILTFTSSDFDNIICEGEQVTLTATGSLLYNFVIDDTVFLGQSGSGTYVTDSIKNGQKISLLGSSNGCEVSAPNSFTFLVNPTPIVNMTSNDSDTTICIGESISFTGTGANLYDFHVNGSSVTGFLINSTYLTSVLNQGDIVSLVGKSNYGCIDTSINEFTLNVNTPPTVLLTSSDLDSKLCIGDSVVFNALGATNYEFFVDGVSQGLSSIVDSIQVLNITNGQSISVIGETDGCFENGDTTYVFDVYSYPIVTLTTQDSVNNSCTGELLNFEGNGGLDYEFFVDGISQGIKSVIDTFSSSSLTNGQVISVVGYNNVCASDGDTAYTVVVNSFPIVNLTSVPAGPNVCFGDTVLFTSTGAASYEYYFNQVKETILSPINTYKNAEIETNDTIKVIGYNGKCPSTIQYLTYTVTKLNLQLTSPNLGMFCDGETVTFNASGATQYQFLLNGIAQGGLSGTSSFSPSPVANEDVVSFYGQGSGCTQKGDDAAVSIFDNPVVTPPGPIKICDGSLVKLTSNATYGNYWYETSTQLVGENDSIYWAPTTGNYSVFFKQGGNGTIWSVGNNFNGELGDSSTFNSINPVIANNVIDGVDIDAGMNHNLIVKSDGSVWAWGDNSYGQMGDGTFTDVISPYQVASISGAQQVSAGDNFSLVLLNAGTLMVFGDNTLGQLGLGSNGIANFPTAVPALSNIASISAGGEFGVALDNAGNIWTWGDNQYGELGNGNFTNTNSPAQIIISNVVQISAGKHHVLALLNDGTVWGWGDNSFGQLGTSGVSFSNTPSRIGMFNNIIDISAGADHSIILDSKNRAYTFGDNTYGQLGTSNNINYTSPKRIENNYFIDIEAGYYTCFGIKPDNSVSSWGKNQYGQLGDGLTASVNSPKYIQKFTGATKIASGEVHTSVLMTQEKACQSNIVNITIDSLPPVVAIATNDTTLSTSTVGVSYQWYLNGNPIPAATYNIWEATTHATYRVEVTFAGGCIGVSNNVIVYPIGMDELNDDFNISIYPNPISEWLNINLVSLTGKTFQKFEISMYNSFGQKVLTDQYFNNSNKINTSSLERGLYLIEIILDDVIISKRVIKQ